MLIGCNLTGGEMDYGTKNVTNPTPNSDYLFVSNQDIDYLAAKKINYVRLLFSWEGMQQTLNGPLSTNTYATTFHSRVNYLTSKGITVMIEPHGASDKNFARYKGNVVGSTEVPNSAFADFWSKMANLYKNNPKVVFGLMNEPTNMSTMQWFNAAQAAINAIRATGATNMIMVPGNGWSGAASWTSNWYDTATTKVSNATGFKTLTDPAKNMVMSVHIYFDTNAGGGSDEVVSATIGVERAQVAVNWAKANGYKVHFSEFGANAATAGASTTVKNFLDYLHANQDVVLGYSWWAYGPPTWWGNYRFTLCPKNNYTTDDVKWTWLAPHLSNLGSVDTGPTPTSPYLPVTYDSNGFFRLNSGQSDYIGYKPDTYKEDKPNSLFIWMHGCGGNAEGDLWMVAPSATRKTQSYIAVSLGGRDGACWQTNNDAPKVLACIDHIKKYFNIDPKRIYLGGYSSGGDMTYRVGMENASKFAGLLIENSDAWGSGKTVQQLIASASWKINIVQLNHTGDTTYPIDKARTNLAALKAAGFPVVAIEKPGGHWDNDNGTTGTKYDWITFVRPYLDAGWVQGGVIAPPPPPPPPTVANITKTSTTVKYPGGQGISVTKVVGDGYANAPAGTYKLTFQTVVTYSGASNFCVDVIVTNDNPDYDLSWDSLQLDLRNHTLQSFGGCSVTGTSGIVTVVPSNKTVLSKNKTAFNLCLTRATDATSYYQVLIKSVKW